MAKYQKILVAIDLSEATNQVLEAAKGMRQNQDAELLLVHIVERINSAYGMEVIGNRSMYQHDLVAAAKEQFATYAGECNIPESRQFVTLGHPQTEIHRLVKEHDVDLVVIGSHGRRGFQRLLLGSTANGVLHGAACDVLAVRVN